MSGWVVQGSDVAAPDTVLELARIMAEHTCWRTETGWACQCGADGGTAPNTDEFAIRWASVHKAMVLAEALGDRLLPAGAEIEEQWRIECEGPGGRTIGAIIRDRAKAQQLLDDNTDADWTGQLMRRIEATTPWAGAPAAPQEPLGQS